MSASVVVGGSEVDLESLVQVGGLRQLLTAIATQLDSQQQRIGTLEEQLDASREEQEKTATELRAALAGKAGEKQVGALAMEVARERAATQKEVRKIEASSEKQLASADRRLASLDAALADARKAIGDKCDARAVSALSARVDCCATLESLADARQEAADAIADAAADASTRADAADALTAEHGAHLDRLDEQAATLCLKTELIDARAELEAGLEARAVATDALASSTRSTLDGLGRELEHVRLDLATKAEHHWAQIQRIDESCKTKADDLHTGAALEKLRQLGRRGNAGADYRLHSNKTVYTVSVTD